MSTVLDAALRADRDTAARPCDVRVALLGLGNVGSAFAALVQQRRESAPRLSIVSALVRDCSRPRPSDGSAIPLTSDPAALLSSNPDVIIEVLGGLEPARTIVGAALDRGIPVVTANKSLLAVHGDELFETAARTGTPLLYEATVLAGVPFLSTFHRRPLARGVTSIQGVVNGTSNFILSRMLTESLPFAEALRTAQRSGYAEPDPAKDINGDDAAEKLCVLVRHFGDWSIAPADVDRTGIEAVELEDLRHAVAFGGRVRPVAVAEWNVTGDRLSAFVGPAFISNSSALANVDGVQNAVLLRTQWFGNLCFSGPGAGPTVTAASILDDVVEARGAVYRPLPTARRPPCVDGPAENGWFVRVSATGLGNEQDAPALLASLGVRLRRTSALFTRESARRQWMLTHPCARGHLAAALDILSSRASGRVAIFRALE